MFNRPSPDSAVALLWVWFMQLVDSWLSTGSKAWLLQSPTTLNQLSKGLLSHYSCGSARVAESDSSFSWHPDSLHQLSNDLWAAAPESPSTNSARVRWAADTYDMYCTICTQQGDSVLGWLSHLNKLGRICWFYPGLLCTTTRLSIRVDRFWKIKSYTFYVVPPIPKL